MGKVAIFFMLASWPHKPVKVAIVHAAIHRLAGDTEARPWREAGNGTPLVVVPMSFLEIERFGNAPRRHPMYFFHKECFFSISLSHPPPLCRIVVISNTTRTVYIYIC